MVWLVTHIWLFIGISALLGLILGWAVRGIRVSGGARRAVVERNIALTELDQVRTELDSLYSAQRTQADDGPTNEELRARDTRLGELEAALTAARDELVSIKAESEKKLLAATTASAVVAGVGAAVISGGSGSEEPAEPLGSNVNTANAQLEWRNRYLESRVRSLENLSETVAKPELQMSEIMDKSERVAELEAGNRALQSQIDALEKQLEDDQSADQNFANGTEGAAAGFGAASTAQVMLDEKSEPAISSVEQDKMAWKNEYLRQRLSFIEAHGIPGSGERLADLAPIEVSKSASDQVVAVDGEPEEPALEIVAESGDIEQELARLRWRNRYLEGRLAYIDGDGSVDKGETDAEMADNAKQSAAEALLERLERSDEADS